MTNLDREFEFNDEDFNFIREMIFKRVGIHIQDHKRNMIYSRIAKRLRNLGIKTFKEYCGFLSSPEGNSEIVDFTNAITTNLTKFFREIHHFDHLESKLLPEVIRKNSSSKRLRIWSAGCSSGMEPYSISMVLRNTFPNVDSWDAKILATDIDTEMLDRGRKGIYRLDDVSNIPVKYKKYVSANKGKQIAEMDDKIKKLISFKQLNFIEKWPVKGPFDIIFCRNVVIYFKKETQRDIFDRFANVLAPGGHIYIGHSENIHAVSDRFEHLGKTIYRKIK